jgi:hypothetical protein
MRSLKAPGAGIPPRPGLAEPLDRMGRPGVRSEDSKEIPMKTAFAMLALASTAQDVDLKVGDPAPKFASTDDAGNAWKSEDVVGKKIVVVYFFPAAFTGG